MALYQTILQPYEVIELCDISDYTPACTIKKIASIETKEFRECIGKELYAAMLADLIDYTGTQGYSGTANYVVDDLVMFSGFVYICIANTTGNTPSNLNYWERAPKFTTDKYNDVWLSGFMGAYIAYAVLNATAAYRETQWTAQGLTVKQGNDFIAASSKSVDRLVSATNADIATNYANMVDFMKQNEAEWAFATKIIKPASCGCGQGCASNTGCLSLKQKKNNPINFY